MQLNDAQIFRLKIPFKTRFTHALATRAVSESVLIALADSEGNIGYGEGAPRDYVTGETMESTIAALHGAMAFLQGSDIQHPQDIAWLLEACDALNAAPSARCALELAMLDLLGKSTRQSVLNMLGAAETEQIFYSAVISGETPETVTRIAQQVAAMRVRQVKLKVGNDDETTRQNIHILREILGENVEIRADVNAAWDLDEAVGHISQLLDLGVFLIEQPLPVGGRDAWLALKSKLPQEARVYVDESVCTFEEARWLAERNAVAGFNLKVSKHGGILPSLDIHALAKQHGLLCQLGCHVGETSLLSAAGRILAALTGDLRACEGSYGLLLLEKDLALKPLQIGFQGIGPVAEVQRNPGLGISVDLGLVGDCLQATL